MGVLTGSQLENPYRSRSQEVGPRSRSLKCARSSSLTRWMEVDPDTVLANKSVEAKLREHLVLLRERLERLARADHVAKDVREVRLEPRRAALELAPLARGHDDEAETERLELPERGERARDGERVVEPVGLVKVLDLAEGLLGRAPAWVLCAR